VRSENIDCLTCALVVITVLVAQSVRSVSKAVLQLRGVSPSSGSARDNYSVFPVFTIYTDTMELLQRNLVLVICSVLLLGPHADGASGSSSRKGESLRPV
jgi:hypothetical protein